MGLTGAALALSSAADATTPRDTNVAAAAIRTWLAGYAGDNSPLGRTAWAEAFYRPQVTNIYIDYETSWSQRAADVALNRANFLPAAADGSVINVLTVGLILSGPGGSQAMNNAGLAAAADGSDRAFVPGMTMVAAAIKSIGLDSPSTVIRLGHEMDGNWYPWSTANRPTAAADFIRAYRRAHDAITAVCPSVRLSECWNTGGSPSLDLHYAGDAYVDIISTDFYDDRAATEADVVVEQHGRGIAQFGAYAHSHGKQFAIDEWGVSGIAGRGRDNPVFIRSVFSELAAIQARYPDTVSHDTYFDEKPYFALSLNPRSAAEYRRRWVTSWTPS